MTLNFNFLCSRYLSLLNRKEICLKIFTRNPKIVSTICFRKSSTVSYVQGQHVLPNSREYFYFIDHQGMLFMDDARIKNFTSCFKEKKFLVFFFSRLRTNTTGRYETEFPYYSPCGREKNYVRCDDLPIVYTHINTTSQNEPKICYGYANDLLSVKFEPEKLIMLPRTGRVYHPAPETLNSIGLIKSALAIELSKYFRFDNGEQNPPTHFTWNGVTYKLVDWYKDLKQLDNISE